MRKLLICINRAYRKDMPSCGARDGAAIATELEEGIAARGLSVPRKRIRCFGWRHPGPNMRIEGGGGPARGNRRRRAPRPGFAGSRSLNLAEKLTRAQRNI